MERKILIFKLNCRLFYDVIKLDVQDCFVIAALLCSSDVIAAVSIIKYDEQPKLFSLIFGEGITNDAISIILFNTVCNAIKDGVTVLTPV